MEQNEILKSYEDKYKQEKNLSFYDLIVAYLIIAVLVFLFIPTIYIRNEIYYISRDIDKLQSRYDILVEENKELKYKIEKIKYQNEVIVPLDIEIGD